MQFTEKEKEKILKAAEKQEKLHSFLMRVNGNPGFCERIETKLNHYVDELEKLKDYFWRLVYFLLGLGVLTGISTALNHFFG